MNYRLALETASALLDLQRFEPLNEANAQQLLLVQNHIRMIHTEISKFFLLSEELRGRPYTDNEREFVLKFMLEHADDIMSILNKRDEGEDFRRIYEIRRALFLSELETQVSSRTGTATPAAYTQWSQAQIIDFFNHIATPSEPAPVAAAASGGGAGGASVSDDRAASPYDALALYFDTGHPSKDFDLGPDLGDDPLGSGVPTSYPPTQGAFLNHYYSSDEDSKKEHESHEKEPDKKS